MLSLCRLETLFKHIGLTSIEGSRSSLLPGSSGIDNQDGFCHHSCCLNIKIVGCNAFRFGVDILHHQQAGHIQLIVECPHA